jgi:dethiobiotin synthetase
MITREDKFKFHMKVLALIANAANDRKKRKQSISALARADMDACFLLIAEEQRESAERYGTTLQEFFKEYERQALERYKELNKLFKEVIGE